jgi:flagellar FliL protein
VPTRPVNDFNGLRPAEWQTTRAGARIARQYLPFNLFLTDPRYRPRNPIQRTIRGQKVATSAAAVKDQDEDRDVEEGAETAAAAEARPRRWSGKRLVLFIGAPVFLVVCLGVGVMLSGVLDPLLGVDKAEAPVEKKVEKRATVFFDVPELLVNLNTSGSRASFLKITVSLELDKPEDIPRIREVMPRILDNFQVYLRELRLDDLRGSAGMYRLREELLARVNAAVAPVKVRDILFKEMLVQ